jgi:acyl carrier protein
MRQSPLERIIKIVSEATKDPEISLNSTQENTVGWDSLAYLVIAQQLEDVFGVEISAKNIDQVASVRGMLELVDAFKGESRV